MVIVRRSISDQILFHTDNTPGQASSPDYKQHGEALHLSWLLQAPVQKKSRKHNCCNKNPCSFLIPKQCFYQLKIHESGSL